MSEGSLVEVEPQQGGGGHAAEEVDIASFEGADLPSQAGPVHAGVSVRVSPCGCLRAGPDVQTDVPSTVSMLMPSS